MIHCKTILSKFMEYNSVTSESMGVKIDSCIEIIIGVQNELVKMFTIWTFLYNNVVNW